MNNQNTRYLIMGLILGILLSMSLSPIMAATHTITAYLRPGFQFFFDGQRVPLPEGQTVLVHEGRSYVPARFVAEQLGAEVVWNESNQSIFITSPEPATAEPEAPEVKEPVAEEIDEQKEEEKQLVGNYLRLPVSQRFRDMIMTVNLIALSEDEFVPGSLRVPATRIFVELENRESTPLQIIQGETRAIVDGKEYRTSEVSFAFRDNTWFRDVRRDEIISGYLVIPDISRDSERMKLYVTVLENDFRQRTRVVEFDILLEFD